MALEFERNRASRIAEQLKVYDDLKKIFADLPKNVNEKTRAKQEGGREKYNLLAKSGLDEIAREASEKATAELDKLIAEHSDVLESAPAREKLAELFRGRISQPYTGERGEEILLRAQRRFELEIPPGYEDKRKPGYQRFGDIVLWFQLLDRARSEQRPIVFVTEDGKKDWWEEGKDSKRPRHELVLEMLHDVGVRFWLYHADGFMDWAEEFFELPKQPEAIEEARTIRQQSEIESQAEVEHSLRNDYLTTWQWNLGSGMPWDPSRADAAGIAERLREYLDSSYLTRSILADEPSIVDRLRARLEHSKETTDMPNRGRTKRSNKERPTNKQASSDDRESNGDDRQG